MEELERLRGNDKAEQLRMNICRKNIHSLFVRNTNIMKYSLSSQIKRVSNGILIRRTTNKKSQ